MKLFTAYITAKRCFYLLILLLLLIILSGVFNFFSAHLILIFHILLLITVLVLFVISSANDKKKSEPLRYKEVKAHLQSYPEDNETGFTTIADQIPFMVWRSDEDGRCIYVNRKWVEFTGVSYQESLGFGFIKTMAIQENHHRRQEWWKMIKGHQPYEIKFQIRSASGELHWALAQANAYHIDHVFMGYIGSIIDITEQENSTIAIQELSDRKDEFLSIASHELKTPLTSIKALFQLIERNLSPDHKVYHFLERANNNILRLETLISDLLDVSKINAGKLNYEHTEFAFQEMMAEAILSMQNIAPNHHFIVKRSDAVKFTGDRFRLEQVIFNFLSNAIKYSPEGKEIIISSEVTNGNIIVSVQDFGIGIQKENLSKIFNRYYRVDNTVMKFDGLGLGLFISSEIIKRHNGSFWIESELGKGSTFYFILPLTDRRIHAEVNTDEFSYYQDETINLQFNAQKNRMDVNWTGYQNFISVQNGCLIMLDLVKKCQAVKVLNDNSKVMGNWSEASDWVSAECLPALAEAGVKYIAWIYSPSIFSQLAADKSADLVLSNITVQFFNDQTSAALWLDTADQ
ncbi:PAS domain S-box-containing protein [Pedobacter cryoconitis]|uniref:PAS domain-containing sensor histidine kinase n=1 Tax=Pedobacter cryoconitis TaxID=188932 RepID=UPI0016075470|nr:PAS domain-containing sensor histidine kinase [Pedobacter cryoconitis]MBB6274274.1 PAS domain S-box-containing protein [Pedobacter cryoconitis]